MIFKISNYLKLTQNKKNTILCDDKIVLKSLMNYYANFNAFDVLIEFYSW